MVNWADAMPSKNGNKRQKQSLKVVKNDEEEKWWEAMMVEEVEEEDSGEENKESLLLCAWWRLYGDPLFILHNRSSPHCSLGSKSILLTI